MLRGRGRNRRWRRGSATVEMAVVMPLLIMIVLGIIEFGWVISVRQTLIHAAREGARTAALPGSTEDQTRAQVDRYLQSMGLSGYAVALEHPTGPENPVEQVTVTYNQPSLVGGFFGKQYFPLTASCVMRKEGFD